MPITKEDLDLARVITELQSNMRSLADTVKRLEDANEGTIERKGMKERITLAEENIKAHKDAWIKNETALKEMEGRMSKTLQEAFMEIKSEFNKRIDGLAEGLKTQQTFVDKARPYINIIAWAVTLIAGLVISQILTGHMAIVLR
jgi:hypothetical protein